MAEKPKPKGWNAMSKAKQDAWKKANFDSSTKVTAAQLDKLRAAKTPAAAIAKYKNDPAMREALNRFYGKAKVTAAAGGSSTASTGPGSGGENSGSGSSSRYRGGPGAKPRPPRSGSGSGSSSSSSSSGGSSTKSKVNVGAAVALGTGLVPLYAKGAMMARENIRAANRVVPVAKLGDNYTKELMKYVAQERKDSKKKVPAVKTTASKTKTASTPSKTTVKKTVTDAATTATKVAKTASKSKVVRAVVKAGKVAGLGTPLGRVATGALLAAPYIKPLKPSKAKQGARKAPMGNPKKK